MVPVPARFGYPILSTALKIAMSCVFVVNYIFYQSAFATNNNLPEQTKEGTPSPTILASPISLVDNQTTPPFQVTNFNHDQNKILDLKPLYLISAAQVKSSKYLLGEASYDQSITLADALTYVLKYGLPMKISQESLNYQHWLTLSNMSSALPSFFMAYSLSRANIFNTDTTSIARSFLTGVSYPVFQGGAVVYSILTQYYREKAGVMHIKRHSMMFFLMFIRSILTLCSTVF